MTHGGVDIEVDSIALDGALARALDAATAAGRMDLVAELLAEIRQRREDAKAATLAPTAKTRQRGA
jgi:hypothetical protein